MNSQPSQAQKILDALLQCRGNWVAMPTLAMSSGAYAVHSRISELRADGLTIENKTENNGRTKASYYRIP